MAKVGNYIGPGAGELLWPLTRARTVTLSPSMPNENETLGEVLSDVPVIQAKVYRTTH
jgi:hypothetical protein